MDLWYIMDMIDGFKSAMILIGIAYLIIDIVAARAFRNIAELKGHEGSSYFWFCFWLGLAGWIMVAALPDLNARPQKPECETMHTRSDDLPDL